MHILDTCALQSIPRARLVEARGQRDIAISTISFLEIFSHLEEAGKFDRVRGNVLKCQVPRMLHDPYAVHAISCGLGSLLHPSRLEDKLLFERVLEVLSQSNTLEEFYAQQVQAPSGEMVSCQDAAGNTFRMLDEIQSEYVESITIKAREILINFSYAASDLIREEDMWTLASNDIRNMTDGYLAALPEADRPERRELLMRVGYSQFMRSVYDYYRAAHYLRAASSRTRLSSEEDVTPAVLHIDPNDCEDSMICMHLNIDTANTLVTGDRRTLQALRFAKQALQNELRSSPLQFHIQSEQEFRDGLSQAEAA